MGTKAKVFIKWAVILAVAFAVVSIVLFYYQSIRNYFKFEEIDFTSYVRASQWFFEGQNPYQEVPRRFIYPLFVLVLLYPFKLLNCTAIGGGISIALWSLGAYLAFFWTIGTSLKLIYNKSSAWESLKSFYLFPVLIVIMLHPFLQDEFLNGQINLYVIVCILGFFVFVETDRRIPAAILIAAAISIKLSPALCLLWVLFTRRYSILFYAMIFVFLMNIVIPQIINSGTIEYYRYFFEEVVPLLTASDAERGFRHFSILSTAGYLFHIQWNPILKLAITALLSGFLISPFIFIHKKSEFCGSAFYDYIIFAGIISVIPLVFPMSEPHHLLILIFPFVAMLVYWKDVIEGHKSIWKDALSLLFIGSVLGLQIGHGLKDTPLRLIGLLGIYTGMVLLSARLMHKRDKTRFTLQ